MLFLKKYYKIFDYGTIAIIAILILLVFFNLVPRDWFITLLILSFVLLVVRIIFKAYIIFQQKKQISGE
jgi:hypothetical protein